MAILVDPLFSDEARGQVASVAVFKRSQVHPVFCAYTSPKVNWTPAKIAQAVAWKSLCDAWRSLPQQDKDAWNAHPPGVLTGFNYFMQYSGVGPPWQPYIPPNGDNIICNLIDIPYTPPAGNQINLNL